jgi:hypothetical protein
MDAMRLGPRPDPYSLTEKDKDGKARGTISTPGQRWWELVSNAHHRYAGSGVGLPPIYCIRSAAETRLAFGKIALLQRAQTIAQL